jgi:hypothetical protein
MLTLQRRTTAVRPFLMRAAVDRYKPFLLGRGRATLGGLSIDWGDPGQEIVMCVLMQPRTSCRRLVVNEP